MEDKTKSGRVSTTMLIGGTVGFLVGFCFGMLINPPISGMTTTSSDVQGLTYFTWFAVGLIGGIIGTIVGVIDFRKLRAGNNRRRAGH